MKKLTALLLALILCLAALPGSLAEGTPVFTMQPVDARAGSGEEVTLHAEAEGAERWQWQYSDDGGETWKNVPWDGAKTDTLTFALNTTRVKNLYRVLAVNADGETASEAVSVALYNAIVILEAPVNTAVPEAGQTVTFHVEATGAERWQWQYMIPDGEQWHNLSEGNFTGTQTDTLSFEVTAARARNSFRCVLSNATTSVETEPVITGIGSWPVFEAQPEDQVCPAGETVTFRAAVTDAVSLQWQYLAPDGDNWHNLSEGNFTGTQTDTVSFTVTEGRAKNAYRLLAAGTAGKVCSNEVHVYTAALPSITEQPQAVSAQAEEEVSLHVGAEYAEQWQWEYSSDGGETWKSLTWDGAKTDTLTFTVNAVRAKNLYRCVLTSGAGSVTTEPVSVSLTEPEPPKPQVMPEDEDEAAEAWMAPPANFTLAQSGSTVTLAWEGEAAGRWAVMELTPAGEQMLAVVEGTGALKWEMQDVQDTRWFAVRAFQADEEAERFGRRSAIRHSGVHTEEVRLNRSGLALRTGESVQLTAEALPETAAWADSILWSSLNPEVATVDGNGVVTAVAPGTTEITAAAGDRAADEAASAVCTVTVAQAVDTRLTVSPLSARLQVGGQITLLKRAAPAMTAVTWSSLNPEVATVDERGLVTALGTGDAVIEVAAADGTKADCVIHVDPMGGEDFTVVSGRTTAVSLRLSAPAETHFTAAGAGVFDTEDTLLGAGLLPPVDVTGSCLDIAVEDLAGLTGVTLRRNTEYGVRFFVCLDGGESRCWSPLYRFATGSGAVSVTDFSVEADVHDAAARLTFEPSREPRFTGAGAALYDEAGALLSEGEFALPEDPGRRLTLADEHLAATLGLRLKSDKTWQVRFWCALNSGPRQWSGSLSFRTAAAEVETLKAAGAVADASVPEAAASRQLAAGECWLLRADTAPAAPADAGLTAVSSDPSVVSVLPWGDGWMVEGRAAGEGAVTVETPGGLRVTVQITVTP